MQQVDAAAGTAVGLWRGLGAAAGVAEGRAHVVRSERDLFGIEAGTVLVLRHPTPAFLHDLIGARAAVCETGGVLNHLAVLARELGVPCVTGVQGLVNALAPGVQLRVDGTNGRVALLAGDADSTATGWDGSVDTTMTAVLRFGRRSAEMERADEPLDLETAVRIASVLTVPERFAGGDRWPYAIEAGVVRVQQAALRGTVDGIVGQVEAGAVSSVTLREWYRAGCAWSGWAVVRAGRRSAAGVRDALTWYVRLQQITWLASAAKEPLVERYRAYLDGVGIGFDATTRAAIFLDSLVMPGRSLVAARQPLPSGDAAARRGRALEALQRGLRPGEYERALRYLSAIGDLVEICERRHTDLAARAAVLFGRRVNRQEVAALLGLAGDEGEASTSAAQQALVATVLDALAGLHGVLNGSGDEAVADERGPARASGVA